MPELAMGDLRAQIATVRVADRNLVEMAEKYGRDTVLATFDDIDASSDRKSRRMIADLPDGEYLAEDVIDGDGVTEDPIAVRVRVTIDGDRMIADFTGSAPTTAGPFNCARGALESAVKTVFKALVDPQAPSNEGWFRALEVVVPDGTVFSADKPAPTGWYYEGSVHASELLWQALAPLRPERFTAGSYTSLTVLYLTGKTADGELFVHIEPQHGGWGASPDCDGASGLIALTDGDTYNHSIELLEAKFPILVRRYGFNTRGGGGAGRQRGGYGLVREYEMLSDDASIYCGVSRNTTPPWGMGGGGVGSCNFIEVQKSGADDVVRLHHHPDWPVGRGDRIRVYSGGGGGWGDPRDREPADVMADVADGLITPAEAEAAYGIAVDAAGEAR